MEGVWQTNDDILRNILLNYFQSLFQSAHYNTHLLEDLPISSLDPIQSYNLSTEFNNNEIFKDTNQLGRSKAPRLDGLPVEFFVDH